MTDPKFTRLVGKLIDDNTCVKLCIDKTCRNSIVYVSTVDAFYHIHSSPGNKLAQVLRIGEYICSDADSRRRLSPEELDELSLLGGEDAGNALCLLSCGFKMWQFRAQGGGSNDESDDDQVIQILQFMYRVRELNVDRFKKMRKHIVCCFESFFAGTSMSDRKYPLQSKFKVPVAPMSDLFMFSEVGMLFCTKLLPNTEKARDLYRSPDHLNLILFNSTKDATTYPKICKRHEIFLLQNVEHISPYISGESLTSDEIQHYKNTGDLHRDIVIDGVPRAFYEIILAKQFGSSVA